MWSDPEWRPLYIQKCIAVHVYCIVGYTHKVLTNVEYRAVSDVFQNIDPPPPLPLASVSFPRTKGGGVHTRRAVRGMGGQFWKTPAIGLASYNNLSTGTPVTLHFFKTEEKYEYEYSSS
jgi:hypothetical protein